MMTGTFLLAVITSPAYWEGEGDCLETLLEAGLEKLHIRKPQGGREGLLDRLASRWSSRLVLHGARDALRLAEAYGIPQVHAHWHQPWSLEREGPRLSASLHSWKEVEQVPPGRLEYVFISPLFDSISKAGYPANGELLQRPAVAAPCRVIGLGGIDVHTIGQVIAQGWDGAAVLGYLWEKPEEALSRFVSLKEIIGSHGR
jgi:thiamine monophosphate synthase